MPISRYQIRSEYSLADPELYRAADRDDPEALLEGVAMAGLVGVLRQLGDLAQFAAEIFHDLHEEVMATSSRGHGLMIRVQQLEAEFPRFEKAFLSQTSHLNFTQNAGIDWRANLQMDQNLVTRGDLPRFIMDSYEECRGTPRLFLLDKFDVAGAGACLKRYSDPSFYKAEVATTRTKNLSIQKEKKTRKSKKRGARWRNGDTPEIFSTSEFNSRLHQLLSDEQSSTSEKVPTYGVKLKRRQLNIASFNSRTGRSYMEKIFEMHPPENEITCDDLLPASNLKMGSIDACEPGPEIYEIGAEGPANKFMKTPSIQEVPDLMSNELDEDVIRTGKLNSSPEMVPKFDVDTTSAASPQVEREYEVVGKNKTETSVNGYTSDEHGVEKNSTTFDEKNYTSAVGSKAESGVYESRSDEFEREKISTALDQVDGKDELVDGKIKPIVDDHDYMSDEVEVLKTSTTLQLVSQNSTTFDEKNYTSAVGSKAESGVYESRSDEFEREKISTALDQVDGKDELVDGKIRPIVDDHGYMFDEVEVLKTSTTLQLVSQKDVLVDSEKKIQVNADDKHEVEKIPTTFYEVNQKKDAFDDDVRETDATTDGCWPHEIKVDKITTVIHQVGEKDDMVSDENKAYSGVNLSMPNEFEAEKIPLTVDNRSRMEAGADGYKSDDFVTEKLPPIFPHLNQKDTLVDDESQAEFDIDGCYISDDAPSEVDNYMDALTTMESEIETDTETRAKHDLGLLNVVSQETDSDINNERELHGQCSDTHSVGNSSMSSEWNSSFKKERSNHSDSESSSNLAGLESPQDNGVASIDMAENFESSFRFGDSYSGSLHDKPCLRPDGKSSYSSDGDPAAEPFLSAKVCPAEIHNLSSEKIMNGSDVLGTKSSGFSAPGEIGNEESDSCHANSVSVLISSSPITEVHDASSEKLMDSGGVLGTESMDRGAPKETSNEESNSCYTDAASTLVQSPSASVKEVHPARADSTEISSSDFEACTREAGEHSGDDFLHVIRLSDCQSQTKELQHTIFTESYPRETLVGGNHEPSLDASLSASDSTDMPQVRKNDDVLEEVLPSGVTTECTCDDLQVAEICDLSSGTRNDASLSNLPKGYVEGCASPAENVTGVMPDSCSSMTIEVPLHLSVVQDVDGCLVGISQPECSSVSLPRIDSINILPIDSVTELDSGVTPYSYSEDSKPAVKLQEMDEFIEHEHKKSTTYVLPLESEHLCSREPCECHVVQVATSCTGLESFPSGKNGLLSKLELQEEEFLPEGTETNSFHEMGNNSEPVDSLSVSVTSSPPVHMSSVEEHKQSIDLEPGSLVLTESNGCCPKQISSLEASDDFTQLEKECLSDPPVHTLLVEDHKQSDDFSQLQEKLLASELANQEDSLESDAREAPSTIHSETEEVLPESTVPSCSKFTDDFHYIAPSEDGQPQLELSRDSEAHVSFTGSNEESVLNLKEDQQTSDSESPKQRYPHVSANDLDSKLKLWEDQEAHDLESRYNKYPHECASDVVPSEQGLHLEVGREENVMTLHEDQQASDSESPYQRYPHVSANDLDSKLKLWEDQEAHDLESPYNKYPHECASDVVPSEQGLHLEVGREENVMTLHEEGESYRSSDLRLQRMESPKAMDPSLVGAYQTSEPEMEMETHSVLSRKKCDGLNMSSAESEAFIPSQPVHSLESAELPVSSDSVTSTPAAITSSFSLLGPGTACEESLELQRSGSLGFPVSSDLQEDLESMPPLPPLPPLEWRMGKLRHTSLTSGGQLVQPSDSDPLLPTIEGQKHQNGPLIFEGETTWSSNPFVSAIEEKKPQHGSPSLGGQTVQSSHSLVPLSMGDEMPLPALDGQVQSSSVPSPVVEDESHSDGLPKLGGVIEQHPDPVSRQAVEVKKPKENCAEDGKPKDAAIEDEKPKDNAIEDGKPKDNAIEDAKQKDNLQLPNRQRDPLIEAVASHDRSMLRKVSDSAQAVKPKPDERNSLLEQIRTKSFNLKPAVVTKPIVQGPKTNLNVVAILEKANAIRQACAGSDEEDDADSWSDS